jgi:hypothetical protein
MWRRITNVAWWLGVSAYFGGLIALGAIAAPAIMKSSTDANLSMPGIASPPLPMDRQVTGQIFGEILNRFTFVEVAALGLMLIGVAGFLFAHTPVRRSVWVLLTLWVLLAAVLGYDAGMLRPKVFEQRTVMYQSAPAHAAEGMNAMWPERIEFDRLHKQSESIGKIKAYLLLGMLLVTAWRGLADRPIKHAPTRSELMREEL